MKKISSAFSIVQAVGDHHLGRDRGELAKDLLEQLLGHGVEVSRRLVQDENQ